MSTPSSHPGPLAGIKVIDVGLLVQGPQAAALLGDMGAEVIKIELPNFGDQSRYIFLGEGDNRSAYFEACNRGKLGMTLNLSKPEGAEILKKLAIDADVLVSNFSTGTLDEWGLGYEALAKLNPGLIWAAGNTFGPLGEDSQREGADLAAQCAGGLVNTTGCDGDPPSPVGVTIADHIGSLNMVCGILAALHARKTTGRGQKVEVSLLGGQIWAQASEYTHYLMTERLPGRSNFGHPLIRGTYRIYATQDGWLGLIGVPAGSLDELLIALDRADMLVDERLTTLTTADGQAWFVSQIEQAFAKRTTDHWCETLRKTAVRYARVQSYAEVVGDSNTWENGYFGSATDAEGIERKFVGSPIRMSATALRPGVQAPTLGQHTEEILQNLGYSDAAIEQLRSEGVC